MRKTVSDWFSKHILESCYVIIYTMAIVAGMLFAFLSPQSATANPVHHQVRPSASCVSGDYTNNIDDDFPSIRTDPEGTTECKVRLRNGRTVTCIDLEDGVSCDWDHATIKKGK